ncbi:MAG: response regulator [Gammaproteobacteria bacterium]|nr:response regulator [Gammaproteobacteria bacterium]MCP5424397.1 response regulator [Gammaproteobacteria bacterium]
MFVVVFVACLLGIWSRPVGFLASVWPANALMIGLLLRVPHAPSWSGWVAAAAAFMTADLATGSTVLNAALLNTANLISVATAYFVLHRLPDDVIRLRQPTSMFYILLAATLGGATAGLLGGLATWLLFDNSVLVSALLWWVSEIANDVALLPILLSSPPLQTLVKAPWKRNWGVNARDLLPTLAVGLSCVIALLVGGPGGIVFPILALLWCGLVYPVFPTSILTLLCSLFALTFFSSGRLHGYALTIDELTLISIRLGISAVAIAPIMLSTVIYKLVQAHQAVEAASQAKSTFLANVSHEMRTPLNAIVGLSEVMINKSDQHPLPRFFTDNLHYIHLSAQHLSEVINNILDLSKIEAGKMELAPATTQLLEVIEDFYSVYKTQAERKGVVLSCECDTNLPQTVRIDAGKVKQVLINLFSNAIKFTPSGKRIDLWFSAEDEQLVFRISDQGIGIPADRLNSIFEDFEQVNGTITRDYGGSGLGLAITKKILTLLEGTVTVESALGQGTTFTIHIPFQEPTVSPRRVPASQPVQPAFAEGLTVLVVEDNLVNQITIEAMLEKSGLKIHFADNGEIGVRRALELQPDLIFMDLHMPVMSGLEATRLIREQPGFEKVPIIALSADALTEQQAEAYASGVSGYLTKPVNSKQLLEVLQQHLEPANDRTAHRRRSPFATDSSSRAWEPRGDGNPPR